MIRPTVSDSRGYLHNNRRIKGTEKFWRDGAEPMLQLAADKISETEPLETYWKNKAETQNGKRKSRAKAYQTLSCSLRPAPKFLRFSSQNPTRYGLALRLHH
jgi:hypothetical protein